MRRQVILTHPFFVPAPHTNTPPRCLLQAGSPQLQREIKVVGCGSCGVDYLASIATFPHPDQKLRTDALEVWFFGVVMGVCK